MINNRDDYLKWFKANIAPNIQDEEELYNLASEYLNSKTGEYLKPYKPLTPLPQEHSAGYANKPVEGDSSYLANLNAEPEKINGLKGMLADLATDFSLSGVLAETFPDGISSLGISADFFEKSYNESIAGMAYQAIYGKPKYEVENYDAGLLGEAGSFMLGMFNAAEVAALFAGGMIGKAVTKGAFKGLKDAGLLAFKNNAMKKGGQKAFEKAVNNSAIKTAMVTEGLGTGIGLGTLGASHSAVHSAAKQRKETGNVDISKTLLDGAKGFGESFLLGVPAGAVAKGYLGSQYALKKLAAKNNKATLDLTSRVLQGFPAQVGVEALAFSAMPTFYKGLGKLAGVEVYEDVPGIFEEGFGRSLIQNTIIVGAMAGTVKITNKLRGIDETANIANQVMEIHKREAAKLVKSAENVEKTMTEAGFSIDPELVKETVKIKQSDYATAEGSAKFLKEQKKVNDVLKKVAKGEKLTQTEIDAAQQHLLSVKLVEQGHLKMMLDDDALFRQVLDEISLSKGNKRITDAEFKVYKESLKSEHKVYEDAFNVTNEQLTGLRNELTKADPGYTPKTLTRESKLVDDKGRPRPAEERIVKSQAEEMAAKKEGFVEEGVTKPVQTKQAPVTEQIRKVFGEEIEKRGIGYDKKSESFRVKELIKDPANQSFAIKKEKQMPNVKVDSVTGSKADIEAVIGFGIETKRGKSYSTQAAKYVDYLHKAKNKKLSDSTVQDINDFLIDVVMASPTKNKLSASDVAPLSKFYEYVHKKFHPDGLSVKNLISYSEVNIAAEKRLTGPEFSDTKLLNKVDESINKVVNKQKKPEAQLLAKLIKYGIRPQELNKMTIKNIREHPKEGWHIDFGVAKGVPVIAKKAKGQTKPNAIPIPEALAKEILNFAGNKKTPIFNKDLKIDKMAAKKKIAMEVFGKDYIDYNLNRNLLRTKAGEVKILDQDISAYLRQDKTRIKTIYKKDPISQILKENKIIQEKLGIRKKGQLQEIVEGPPESAKTLSPWLDNQIKKNPGIKLKKIDDANYAGRFYEGVIDITMGKSNKFTFFHENAHRLESMIKTTGNTRLNKVWNQAKKIFAQDVKKSNKSFSEFIADEIASYGLKRQQPATLKQKMGAWLNRLYSNVKSVFFGKENLNKNDIRNILGDKVYKGFAFNANARATSIAQYKYENTAEYAKGVKKEFNDALNNNNLKLTKKEKAELVEYLAEKSGMENPKDFILGDANTTDLNLELFRKVLGSMPFKDMKRTAQLSEKFKLISKIEKYAKNIPEEQTKNIMKALNFKKETLFGASRRELKSYLSAVGELNMPAKDRYQGLVSSGNMGEMNKIMDSLDGMLGDAYKFALPTNSILRKLGGKAEKIASKLEDHASIELAHTGEFVVFEVAMEKLFGKGKFAKAGDKLYLSDTERYIERLQNDLLTKSEKAFVKKAFASDYVIKKDGKFIKNPKYKKRLDGVNMSTNEGKLISGWNNYTEYVYKSFKKAIKANLSEAEYAEFVKENKINWIRDNIYVSRVATPEFIRILRHSQDKLIDEQSIPIARRLAKEKYNTNKPTDEQVLSMKEDARAHVDANLVDLFGFSDTKMHSKYLKSRHEKLPEFIEFEGKKVKVYETSYENTAKKYALGMSKFMATAEVLPEYVNFKGYGVPDIKSFIGKVKRENPKWGDFILKQVDKQAGVTRMFEPSGGAVSGAFSTLSTFLAKTQLSFPTAGSKNLILGQIALTQAFRMRDYFKAIAMTMSSEFRREVRGLGATEIGLRNIIETRNLKFLDKIFWFGGMKPSENINRYMSVAMSKIEQQRLVKILQFGGSKKQEANANRKLKEFYSLTDEQRALLKKYGLNGTDNIKFKSSYERAKVDRQLQNIYEKMNNMAHIKTQGAALSLFTPEWMDKPMTKSFLLFQRMAYASTVNTINNFSLARRNGNMVKMAAIAMGPFVAGQAMMAIYDMVFDEKPPKENSDTFTWMKHTLMRGEALGVLSNFLRLYEGEGVRYTIQPAVFNYAQLMYESFVPLARGQKTWNQSLQEASKGSVALYRQTLKLIESRDNKEFVKMKRMRRLYYDFEDEMFPDKQYDATGNKYMTRRSKYYKDFNTLFYKGTPEEFTRHTIVMTYAIATDLIKENINADGTSAKYGKDPKGFSEALKQAAIIVQGKLKAVNPNPSRFMKNEPKRFKMWQNWLNKDKERSKEYFYDLRVLDSYYKQRMNEFEKLAPKMFSDQEVINMIKKEMKSLK